MEEILANIDAGVKAGMEKAKFTLMDIDEILSHPNIKVFHSDNWRVREFEIEGDLYAIEWYCNVSTLYSKGLLIQFDHAGLSNTWPHRSKMDIQFYDRLDEVIAVLKVEK